MQAIVLVATFIAATAHADTFRFKSVDGHFDTRGDGCSSGRVMKEVTRALADSIEDGLTVSIEAGKFEVVKAIKPDGEKRMRAPRTASTSGGEIGMWSAAAKTGPGDVLTTITVGDVLPDDPFATAHGASEMKLGKLTGAKVGVEMRFGYAGCTARWTNPNGTRK